MFVRHDFPVMAGMGMEDLKPCSVLDLKRMSEVSSTNSHSPSTYRSQQLYSL